MKETWKNGVCYDNEVYPSQCKPVCQFCGRERGDRHKQTCKYWNHPMSAV